MFSLFSNTSSVKEYVGFEDIKHAIRNTREFILINTLPSNEQDVLIFGTLPCDREEVTINEQISNYRTPDLPVIVYGRNCSDTTVVQKQEQLTSLGVKDVYLYMGGMFEWLLMQDVYGFDEFPTTTKICDILKFRSPSRLEKRMLLEY